MDLLFLLVEKRGELVTREEVADRLWGTTVFVDIDQSINTAIRKVRIALHDDPERPRFVETVVGKGYRFAAPVVVNGEGTVSAKAGLPGTPQPAQAGESAAIGAVPAQQIYRRPPVLMLLAGIGAVLAILASGWIVIHNRNTGRSAHPGIKSLVVLPLKNLSGDPGQEYLADGMTEALVSRLSGIHDLRVISRTSSMRLKNSDLSVPEIAKALQVDVLVEGSVIREGNRIRVTAQLIRGTTDEHFWSETYDREMPDVLALQSDVAQAIARKVEVTFTGDERARLAATRSVAPEVYESYLKGAFGKNNRRTDIETSIGYFEEAIRKDPTFAPAYVGLAFAYDDLGTVLPPEEVGPKAISAARRALELDPDLADAHALLGEMYQLQWQWAEAQAEYKRALELNRNDAAAHLGLANWLLCQGRTEEALVWSRRARELDPLGVTGLSNGWILFQARRYDEAIGELRSVLAVHPDYATAHWFLGYALIANGQSEEAITALHKAVSLSGGSPAVIGTLVRAYAQSGRRTEALRLVDELKRRQRRNYVPAAAFLDAYLGLGERDQAFAWLERAYQEQSSILQLLKVHPLFDPLRGDPRFADLIHRVGLG
jgi:TolB-like protein/tetratricopeptide (TPR) repeat protein/DNA-binding winged helix-turn-helix (wHTH) protein